MAKYFPSLGFGSHLGQTGALSCPLGLCVPVTLSLLAISSISFTRLSGIIMGRLKVANRKLVKGERVWRRNVIYKYVMGIKVV